MDAFDRLALELDETDDIVWGRDSDGCSLNTDKLAALLRARIGPRLDKEEIEALSGCVGSAIGEFGVSEATDLAIQALAKLRLALAAWENRPDS